MRALVSIAAVLIIISVMAGCTGNPGKSTYSVDDKGVLSLTCAPVPSTEEILFTNETYTKSRILFRTESGDVVSYLGAPKEPKAVIVYASGAGEKLAGHEGRMIRYASAGYAFLFIDTRGNGGETKGIPFGQQLIQQDYALFEKGEMPQYYLSICDLVSAQQLLTGKYQVPVYVVGSSNGGRYAAVAAGTDPAFAGYIGISTSDWGLLDSLTTQGVTGAPVRFAASIEPGTYFEKISPRMVWIFHAKADPIIPFESGQQFFNKAHEPKTFVEFSGDHGINPDVDERIIMLVGANLWQPRVNR
jgi:dipeptidyl aminopeptidase/acylaminoacyl peptidase